MTLRRDGEKTRAWLKKRAPLPKATAPMQRSPLKKQNATRLKKLKLEQFGGAYADYVRSEMCAIAKLSYVDPECEGVVVCAHVRSRGAGGKAQDIVALCSRHHFEQHSGGFGFLTDKYGIHKEELGWLAKRLYAAYHNEAA